MAMKHSGLGRGLDALIPPKKNIKTTVNKAASSENQKGNHSVNGHGTDGDLLDNEEVVFADRVSRKGKAAASLKSRPESRIKSKSVSLSSVSDENAAMLVASQTDKNARSVAETPLHAEISVKISLVEPNRSQPRKKFADEPLKELADSIRQYGVIQPLLVQKKDDYYEIIAGERRWRAAKMAGLKEIPVLVKDFTNQKAVEVSLIENIQREDLNPIEEARAYKRLIDEFSLRQEDVADRVSRNRTSVTNSIRLLKLDSRVQDMVVDGSLTEGHARSLLMIPDPDIQYQYATRILKEHLSVRQTEQLVKKLMDPKKHTVKKKTVDAQKETVLRNISDRMKDILGTKVSINQVGKNKGRIEIEYYSEDELERIYDLIQRLRGINE